MECKLQYVLDAEYTWCYVTILEQHCSMSKQGVTVSPNRPNIKYVVHLKPGTLEAVFVSLVEEVKRLRLSMDQTIIFCRTYDSCSMLYLSIKDRLGTEFANLIGAPD